MSEETCICSGLAEFVSTLMACATTSKKKSGIEGMGAGIFYVYGYCFSSSSPGNNIILVFLCATAVGGLFCI